MHVCIRNIDIHYNNQDPQVIVLTNLYSIQPYIVLGSSTSTILYYFRERTQKQPTMHVEIGYKILVYSFSVFSSVFLFATDVYDVIFYNGDQQENPKTVAEC